MTDTNNTPYPPPDGPVPIPAPRRPDPDALRRCARWTLVAATGVAVWFLPIQVGFVSDDREVGIQATGYSTLIGLAVIIAVALLWRYLRPACRHPRTHTDDTTLRRVDDQTLDALARLDEVRDLLAIVASRRCGESETQRLLDTVTGGGDWLPTEPLPGPGPRGGENTPPAVPGHGPTRDRG